jgi:hypothetical protein
MSPSSASFLAGGLGLLAFALLGLLALRLPGRLTPVPRLALLALAVHGLTVLLSALLLPGATYWHGAALYWFGFTCYLFGFCAVYKSVSLGILSQLARSPDECLPLDAISKTHIQPCFTGRADLLVESGLARQDQGRYCVTARGRRLAARFGRVQRFFGVRRSGLYTPSE